MITPEPIAPGTILLGRFTVDRILGHGGEGVVVAARQEGDGPALALKVYRRGGASPLAELRFLVGLSHPGILQVHEVGEDAVHGSVLVMDLVLGPDLGTWLHGASPASRDRAALRLLEALAYIQGEGLVHGDLKPSNVLVSDPDGTDPLPVITDFGLAERRVGLAFRGGSPAYLAPEVVAGGLPDFRSDLYALGLTWLQGLTRDALPRRSVPRDLAVTPLERRLLRRLLAPNPEERYPDAQTALAAVVPVAVPDGPVRLPNRLPLQGSQRWLDAWTRALESLREGAAGIPVVVAIEGDRGLGRGRLREEAALRARLARVAWVPWEDDTGVVDLMAVALDAAGTDPTRRDALLEDLTADLATDDAGQDLGARAAALLRVATRCPLALGGPLTGRTEADLRSFLLAVVRAERVARESGEGARLLVLTTGPAAAAQDLAPDDTLTLRPWSLPRVETVVSAIVGPARPPDVQRLAARLHEETGGHPGRIDGVLRSLVSQGALVRRGGLLDLGDLDRALEVEAPEAGVMAAIPDGTRDLVDLLAVRGGAATGGELGRVVPGARSLVLSLRRAGVVTVSHRPRGMVVRLIHRGAAGSLIRSLDPARRRALHRIWADGADDPLERGLHAIRGGAPPRGIVRDLIDILTKLATRPTHQALAAAEEILEGPLPTRDERSDLSLLQARLLLKAGLAGEAREVLRALEDPGGTPRQSEVDALLADIALAQGLPAAAEEAARRAVATAMDDGPRSRAGATLAWVLLQQGRLREARDVASTAAGAAGPQQAAALNIAALAAWRLGETETARTHFGRARDLLLRAGRDVAAHLIDANLGLLALRAGALDEAAEHFDVAELAAVRAGLPLIGAQVLGNRGILLKLRGQPEDSASAHRAARTRFLESGEPVRAAMAQASEGISWLDAGRPFDAWRALSESLLVLQGAAPAVRALVHAHAARAATLLGRVRTSRRHAARALRLARHGTPPATLAEAALAAAGVSGGRRRGAIDRALSVAERSGDERLVAEALLLRAGDVLAPPARPTVPAVGADGDADADANANAAPAAATDTAASLPSPLDDPRLDHPTTAARRDLLLVRHQAPERRSPILARGLRHARRRGDRLTQARLGALAVAHLLSRDRGTSARRRWARTRRILLDMEEGMPIRQSHLFRITTDGQMIQELMSVIENRLLALDRGTEAGLLLEREELLRTLAALNGEESLPALLDRVLDGLLRLTHAERSLLVLLEGDELRFAATRQRGGTEVSEPEKHLSTTVVHEVIATGRSLVVADALGDDQWRGLVSVASHRIRALACVPLSVAGRRLGAVYLDGGREKGLFDPGELPLIEAFADLAALAIRNLNRRLKDVDRRRILERELQTQRSLAQAHAREAERARPRVALSGRSPAFQALDSLVTKAARAPINILVTGESGTGKELVARAIHERSPRHRGPWVAVNAAAIPKELFEAELFGHERGAFTGAEGARPGLFRLADGGTLFLDEVGELPLPVQSRLLRVLQEKEVRPLGSEVTESVDFRLVAATNRDLAALVQGGAFREDLVFRLRGMEIAVPPLRSRKDDIIPLAEEFLGPGRTLSQEARDLLLAYPWPGNVRQLQNEMQRARILATQDEILPSHLSPELQGELPELPSGDTMPLRLEDWERRAILHALQQARGDRKQAARLLGISRSTLYKKLERFSLS